MKIDPPSVRAGLAISLRRGKQFFAGPKRRNVYRVAVACAIVAGLLIQIATQVLCGNGTA